MAHAEQRNLGWMRTTGRRILRRFPSCRVRRASTKRRLTPGQVRRVPMHRHPSPSTVHQRSATWQPAPRSRQTPVPLRRRRGRFDEPARAERTREPSSLLCHDRLGGGRLNQVRPTSAGSHLRLVWPQWQGAGTASIRGLAPEGGLGAHRSRRPRGPRHAASDDDHRSGRAGRHV